MTEVTVDWRTVAIDALSGAADDFAVRAQLQEACRDRRSPAPAGNTTTPTRPPCGGWPSRASVPASASWSYVRP